MNRLVLYISRVFLVTFVIVDLVQTQYDSHDNWPGNYFPYGPDAVDNNPVVENLDEVNAPKGLMHDHKVASMGINNPDCDNAKVNLTLDWNHSPVNYTCFEDRNNYRPNIHTCAFLHHDFIPKGYSAMHFCMNTSIDYEDAIPTFGSHRPLWPKYGEYRFVPPQRWIHSLEHGAIVMLYHPCANKNEVKLLKQIVRSCVWKHIITPYSLLTTERPLALVAWGSFLAMSKVDDILVVDYIRKEAQKAPEKIFKDGQFEDGLIVPALIVSDDKDSKICPNA